MAGPGFNHFYLECLEDFLPQAGIRFWYYDQLGCGFSDTPDEVSLWTVDRYREEVEQVRPRSVSSVSFSTAIPGRHARHGIRIALSRNIWRGSSSPT